MCIRKIDQVDLQDDNRQAPLMFASMEGNSKVVTLLLEKGAQVDLQDIDGWSALMHAIKQEHLQVVQVLLSYGADVYLQLVCPLGKPTQLGTANRTA